MRNALTCKEFTEHFVSGPLGKHPRDQPSLLAMPDAPKGTRSMVKRRKRTKRVTCARAKQPHDEDEAEAKALANQILGRHCESLTIADLALMQSDDRKAVLKTVKGATSHNSDFKVTVELDKEMRRNKAKGAALKETGSDSGEESDSSQ